MFFMLEEARKWLKCSEVPDLTKILGNIFRTSGNQVEAFHFIQIRNLISLRTFVVILTLFIWVMPVRAHGGGVLQVANEAAGPYKVSVWTSPSPVENGRPIHITIGVAGGAEDEPILDAEVSVQATSRNTNQTISATATTEQATNKLFYEADFTLPEQGIYDIQVQIAGTEGEGAVVFEVEALPPGNNSWWMMGFIGLGIVASFVLFRLWEGQTAVNNPAKNRLSVDKPSDSSVASE